MQAPSQEENERMPPCGKSIFVPASCSTSSLFKDVGQKWSGEALHFPAPQFSQYVTKLVSQYGQQ
jgi:hypothetical protein